jgi:hypothetical protein
MLRGVGMQFAALLLCISCEAADRIGLPVPTQVIITSGGQKRGTISGKFSLKFLPSLISSDKK